MSAVPQLFDEAPFDGRTRNLGRPAHRGHLRLISDSGRVLVDGRSPEETEAVSGVTVARGHAGPSPLRITRAGRLALTLTTLGVLAVPAMHALVPVRDLPAHAPVTAQSVVDAQSGTAR